MVEPPSLRGTRILIAEDEALVAQALRERLHRLGAHIVDVVDTGAAACERAGALRPDLVLMDIGLAGAMTGIEAAETIRERTRVPVVFVTAHADPETLLRARASGPFGYVLKPYVEGDLVTTLHVAIARHRAARSLDQSESKYVAAMRGLAEAVIAVDPDGRVTFMNPAAEELTGWTADDACARPITEVCVLSSAGDADEHPALRARDARMRVHVPGPVWLQTRDGRRTPVTVAASPIVVAYEPERVLGSVLSLRDLSDQIRAGERLRQHQRLLATLVEHAPAAIAMLDLDMRYLAWSRRWLSDYRLPERDLTGLSHYEVFPETRARWQDVHQRVLAGATESADADELLRADGSLDVVRWVAKPWRAADDRIGGIIFFSEVITERVMAERALARSEKERRALEHERRQAAKMEAVGRLAAGIAHDFNNLLTVINGSAHELEQDPALAHASRELARDIHLAGLRAARLTSQLLAFGRRQQLHPAAIDLRELVSDVSAMLDRMLGEDIALSRKVAPDVWRIEADPGQIEQVIVNLAVNARDAMPTGGVIELEANNALVRAGDDAAPSGVRPGRWVRLRVRDTGAGMDAVTKERVFEPFFTTKPGDRGLGLATVYNIVTQSGGGIHVESAPGEGACFDVYFPAVAAEATGPGPAPATTSHAPAGDATILVVEDEPNVRAVIARALRRVGYTVLEASDPQHALALVAARGGAIDLLVTDVVMPGMSGQELSAEVARLAPRAQTLYVSGYDDDEVLKRGVRCDEGLFLQKPFAAAELARMVRAALDQRGSASNVK